MSNCIIEIISMIIPIIIGALGTVTKRLADNYTIIKLKILSKVAPRQTKLLGTLRILQILIVIEEKLLDISNLKSKFSMFSANGCVLL